MGMYDSIRCERPLPDGWQPDELMQTKDLDCELLEYVITKDGRLLCDRGHFENLPDRYLEYGEAFRLFTDTVNAPKRVPKLVETGFGGLIRFGGLEVIGYETDQRYGRPVTYRSSINSVVVGGKPIYKRHDYRAKFTDGQLIEIVMDET
jgi:hypothetical protein